VAEICEVVVELTGLVATAKFADVAPAATVTEAGTWTAAVLVEARFTTAPPGGAAPLRVTVPVEGLPPTTEAESKVKEVRSTGGAGWTVRVAVRLTLLKRAVIVTGVFASTGTVVAANVAVVAPATTVTEAGTWATAVLLEVRVTTAPPVGAGLSSVTVPVEDSPPMTAAGARPTEVRTGACTVRVAVRLTLAKEAVIVTDAFESTATVVAVKVAVVAPAATVTDAGTWAAAVLLEVSVTTAPPAGAGPLSVAVPVEGLPPMTEVGTRPTEVRTGAVTVRVAVRLTPL
jgi:hypothetical protein